MTRMQCPTPIPLRSLGHAALCGVLYVAYQSKSDPVGNYMSCILFRSHLLLAASKSEKAAFEIVAVISLKDAHIDRADNGKGKSFLMICDGS